MSNTFTQLETDEFYGFTALNLNEFYSIGFRRTNFYDFTALNYNIVSPREILLKSEEIVRREILTDTLVEAVRAGWSDIKGEVKELLRSYEIPEEYMEQVISEVRRRVKSKLQGLPDEDWLVDILTKLYLRITYEMLRT